MSSAHDAHAAPAHAHDDHETFDGEPAKELSPGEPRSPAWLPALGAALFALAAVYMLTGSSNPAEGAATTAAPKAPPVAEAAPTPPPQPHREAPAAAPGPAASAGMRKLTPEQVQELQKKIQEARGKGILPARPAQPGK